VAQGCLKIATLRLRLIIVSEMISIRDVWILVFWVHICIHRVASVSTFAKLSHQAS